MDMTVAQIEAELREKDQEALEAYRHGTAEAPVLYSANFTGLVKATDDAGARVFVASEETPDRMGDILTVAGWDTKNFNRNPVMLYAYNHQMLPPARAGKVWKDGKQLLNTVEFDEDDPLGAALKGKYERGMMRGESVGFRPVEFKERDDDDAQKQRFGRGILFTKQELVEISLVAVPAHPMALRKMLGDVPFTITMPERVIEIFEVKPQKKAIVSRAMKTKLSKARDLLSEVLTEADGESGDDKDKKSLDAPDAAPAPEAIKADDDAPEEEDIDWGGLLEATRKVKEELAT